MDRRQLRVLPRALRNPFFFPSPFKDFTGPDATPCRQSPTDPQHCVVHFLGGLNETSIFSHLLSVRQVVYHSFVGSFVSSQPSQARAFLRKKKRRVPVAHVASTLERELFTTFVFRNMAHIPFLLYPLHSHSAGRPEPTPTDETRTGTTGDSERWMLVMEFFFLARCT